MTGWLGFVLGAVALTKYHGLLLVPAILAPFAWGAVVGKRSLWPFVNAGLIAATMIAPVLIRNALITENPVFPTFHQHFGPDNLDVFAPFLQAMASRPPVPGGGWALPWTMFVLQDFFDGLQFGYPLFLLLIPFALLAQVRARLPVLAVCVLFVAAWWALMPHLLRFLMPLFGLAAALSACGLHHVARTAAHLRWFQAIFTAFCIIAVALQSLFVGSSALYRLPAALGLVDLRSVLENPAFRYYGLISPCLWINDRLAPGERYLPLINDPSAFCPQAAVMHALEPGEAAAFYTKTGLPAPSARDLAAKMRRENVRYVLAAVNLGADDERYAFAKHRFDALIEPILDAQTPLLDSPSGDVYDAAPIIAALERAAFEETQQSPKP